MIKIIDTASDVSFDRIHV